MTKKPYFRANFQHERFFLTFFMNDILKVQSLGNNHFFFLKPKVRMHSWASEIDETSGRPVFLEYPVKYWYFVKHQSSKKKLVQVVFYML